MNILFQISILIICIILLYLLCLRPYYNACKSLEQHITKIEQLKEIDKKIERLDRVYVTLSDLDDKKLVMQRMNKLHEEFDRVNNQKRSEF